MKPYESAMICGRFQTVHKGHEKLIEAALSISDRLLILVGSAQEYGTLRNPYNIETRIEMLREIYGDNPNIIIRGLVDLSTENDITTAWGDYLLENVDRYLYKNPEVMVYGKEENRLKWFTEEALKDTTELVINRQALPISATMLRYKMLLDERKEWMARVNPRLHKMYDTLRGELLAVPEYQEILKTLIAEKHKLS